MAKQKRATPRKSAAKDAPPAPTADESAPSAADEQIERLREATGANHLVTMLQFGVLNDELTRRNMELFASEVMPHLRN